MYDYIVNDHATTETHHYKLEPGDGTMYRFGFSEFKPGAAYVMDSGVGRSGEEYIWAYIKMASSTGVATIMKSSLENFRGPYGEQLVSYLKSSGHGWENIGDYTAVAVLLALSVLKDDPWDVEGAAQAMMDTRGLILSWMEEDDETVD